MSREIKFRAWLKIEKKMVDVLSIDFDTKIIVFYNQDDEYEDVIREEFVPFENIELMQYTGLKDKNGVEIYEGNIVKDEKERLFVIEYKFGGFNLAPIKYYNDEFSWNAMGDMQCAGFIRDCCEVIGNVWENKELLEND